MAPRKRHARNISNITQAVPIAAQSDYETDTANLTDIASAINHPPPARTNNELNLTVLQRYSPGIEHIVAIAPFAVVYTFSVTSQSWEKCGMEGTLFVCQLSGPRWKVIVLNRKSLENFIAELHTPEDIEITNDYVILQVPNAEGDAQIFGLWIFSDTTESVSTRDTVAQAIQACAAQAYAIAGMAEEAYDEEQNYAAEDAPAYHEPQAADIQPVGQSLDLSQIFNKNTQSISGFPGEQSVVYQNPKAPGSYSNYNPQLAIHDDSAFFRAPTDQMGYEQSRAQPTPISSQQDALLGLFRR